MIRLLSRSRKAEAAEGDEPKNFKKADLGGPNKMYYNDELKMWVERGKEDEARAEKAKLSAPPPPSVGSMSAASSTTSLAAMGGGDGGAPAMPNFSRSKGLAGRYVALPGMATTPGQPPAAAAAAASPVPNGGKALLPGGGGRAKLPGGGLPTSGLGAALPGSGPPSFFMPTPAASEVASDTGLGGSELGSVSGLSGLDPGSAAGGPSLPNSRSASQPSLFMPGPRVPSSTTDDTASSTAAGAGGLLASSSGGGTATGSSSGQLPASEDAAAAGLSTSGSASLRVSSASDNPGGRLPALSGPSNLSFANWQPPVLGSPGKAAAAPQGGVQLAQQDSSADMEADAEAEVSSPDPLAFVKQQQQDGSKLDAAANGHDAAALPFDGYGDSGEAAAPGPWDARPAADPFDFGSSGGTTAAAGAAAALAAEGGGDWQQQQPESQQYGGYGYGEQQQQRDPLAYDGQQPLEQQAQDPSAVGTQPAQAWAPAVDGTQQQGEYAVAGWQQQYPQQEQQYAGYDAAANGYYAAANGYYDAAAAANGGYYQQPTADGYYAGSSGYKQQQRSSLDVLQPVHPELPGIATVSAPREGSGSVASPSAGFGHPGSSGGSKGAARRSSMPGSPLTHQSSLGTLLPQPPRASAAGLSSQRSGTQGGDASALTVPAAAAAGDASMLFAVRPSSPYARAVSPLSRTSTGVPDATATAGGGFPIPSPPSSSGMLSGRTRSGHMFIPGGGAAAAGPGGSMPWQPRPSAAGSADGHAHQQYEQQQQQQQQQQLYMNGHAASSDHLQQQQQHAMPPAPGIGSSTNGLGWMPGTLEALPKPLDAQPTSAQRDSSRSAAAPAASGPHNYSSCSSTAGSKPAPRNTRAHPYEQFLAASLAQINWRAHHFKRPGKLNKLLPWEELEMQQARKEEAERLAAQQAVEGPLSGASRRERAFWYRQMVHRQTLPPAAEKASNSEPAALPSHAVGAAGAQQPNLSHNSQPAGWQQQQHHQPAMSCPLTPARAATSGAIGAVAGAADGEEWTPTSKLHQAAASAAAEPAAAAEPLQPSAEAAGAPADQPQQEWAAWSGYDQQQQQAAAGDAAYWQQQQYGQEYYQQQYNQEGTAEGGACEHQQYYADQQQQQPGAYHQAQWQQQQGGEEGDAAAQQQQQQQQQQERGGTWGSPDAETQAAHDAAVHGDALHPPEVVDAARAARISTSSVGLLDSQPSTGRLAAAAARHITAAAFDSVLAQHTVQEEGEAEALAAAAAEEADNGWLADDAVEGIVAEAAAGQDGAASLNLAPAGAGGEQQQAQQESAAEAGADAPAQPVGPPGWHKLKQQLDSAAAAATAAGTFTPEIAQYKDYFVQYGEYVLQQLPVEAEADEAPAAAATQQPEPTATAAAAAAAAPAGAAAGASSAAGHAEDEEPKADDEFWAEFGEMSLRNEMLTAMFASAGFDLDLALGMRAAVV